VLRLGRRHGVTVTADPADMAGLLAEADLVALPIRAGGGTRIKVLDAMAHGVPVVATRLAVEGLGVIETLHFHRAETVRDFVRAIAHIAAGADVEPMRAAAWRHCLRHFGPEAIAEAVTLGLAAP
jgi:glycosyltransferase involved in cell wall biosynthesis